jgi:hypothetical protein
VSFSQCARSKGRYLVRHLRTSRHRVAELLPDEGEEDDAMDLHQMKQAARALTFELITCDCGGTGVLTRRSVQGIKSDPCHGCDGTGRWWAHIGRHYLSVRLTDSQMLDLIRRETTGKTAQE